ncbi:head-tail connector protein [Sphingomonas aerolata]|uniref:head-tail connector protein n=1 Tax=Sphingomonas aerolata TaxID=185951 RepID=UPI002FE19B95
MADEPVTLDQVKTHLRLGTSEHEDAYLGILIGAARRAIENLTGRDIAVDVPTLDERDKDVVAQASLLLIGQWYSNREAVGVNVSEIPLAVQFLLNPLRVMFV